MLFSPPSVFFRSFLFQSLDSVWVSWSNVLVHFIRVHPQSPLTTVFWFSPCISSVIDPPLQVFPRDPFCLLVRDPKKCKVICPARTESHLWILNSLRLLAYLTSRSTRNILFSAITTFQKGQCAFCPWPSHRPLFPTVEVNLSSINLNKWN